MEKITFFENLGGFFISPKNQTLDILAQKERNWNPLFFQSFIVMFVSSVFAGCVLMFFMMYPEIFFVPGALHEGNLFVYAAANPIFIMGMLGLGILLVLIYDFLFLGSLSYLNLHLNLKRSSEHSTLSYGRYMSLFAFTHIFTALFHMITVLWMYFFEKFSYTKIFFPITDFTFPVIIHLLILTIFVILKWIWEYRINLGIFRWAGTFKKNRTIFFLIWMSVKIIFTATVIFVVYLSGNLIAGAQWS
jgi:hypothetical protein